MRRLSVKPTFAKKPELLFKRNGSTHTLLEDVQQGLKELETERGADNKLETELADLMTITGGSGNMMKTSGAKMNSAGTMQRTFSGGVGEYLEFLDSADAPKEEKAKFVRSASARLYDNSATDNTTSASEGNYQSIMDAQLTKTLALKSGTPEHEAHLTGVEKKNTNLFARSFSGQWYGGVSSANNPEFEFEREQTRRMAMGLNNTIEKQDGDGWMGSAGGFILFSYLGYFVFDDVRFWTMSLVGGAGWSRTPEPFERR
jgi:hypothetical protein